MLEKLLMGCKTAKSFIFGGEFSIYELLLKAIEKLNEVIDYVNSFVTGYDQQLKTLQETKEDKVNITNARKLSPNGDFTGSIHGKQSNIVLAELDTNSDKIDYLINQFSDGQTGLVVDGGWFDESGIRKNYDGGIWT